MPRLEQHVYPVPEHLRLDSMLALPRQRIRVACALIAGLVTLASVAPARAQSASDKAAAEALFDQGKKLIQQKNYAEACPKFEQSQKLDPGIGTLLFLGECYERAGRSASAWATFREAAAAAATANDKRERVARGRAERLEPKLSKLVVQVEAPPAGLVITRNGDEIPSALWGTEIPVDPGEHTIEARAPGKVTYSTQVTVGAEAAKETLKLPTLEDEPEPEPAPVPPPAESPPDPKPAGTAPTTEPPPDPGAEVSDGSTQRTIGLVVAGVGVVGVGVGSYFGLQASSKNSDADKECRSNDPTRCSQAGVDLGQEAEDAATLSTISFAIGGLALAGGLVLYFTAPSAPEAAQRVRVTPVAGRDGGGVWLQGAF